jgi:hypothetical protein
MAYGYDAKVFSPVMDKIPEGRAKKCKFEYDDIKFAFRQVFGPHLDYQMVRKILDTKSFADLLK